MEQPSNQPYVGLRPYEETERDYFFGREQDAIIIGANLSSEPLTVLYGSSGVGKSSLLHAAVKPRLMARPHTSVIVFSDWNTAGLLERLKAECVSAIASPLEAGLPLDQILLRAQRELGDSILIVFDQFEEYLLRAETAPDEAFESEFASAVNRTGTAAGFLVSLRKDWLSGLDRLGVRIPNLLSNTLELRRLDRAAAEQAIRKPLDVYNRQHPDPAGAVSIEDELVRAVLEQVRAGRIRLDDRAAPAAAGVDSRDEIDAPFLQLVMTRLWKEETAVGSRVLRLETLTRLGGAEKIVKAYLGEVMRAMTESQREIAARMFVHLVTPSGSKIPQKTEDLVAVSGGQSAGARGVLDILAGKRILARIDQPERYQISHDALAPAVLEWRNRYEKAKQAREAWRWRAVAAMLALLLIATVWLALLFRGEKHLALSRALAAHATVQVENGDAELGILLALEASRVYMPMLPEVEQTLHAALQGSRVRFRLNADGPVVQVAATHDGKYFATVDDRGTIRLWLAGSGKEANAVAGNKKILQARFSADGSLLLIVDIDDAAHVMSTVTGAEQMLVPASEQLTMSGAISADGRRLAAADSKGRVSIWDISRRAKLRQLGGQQDPLSAAAFSGDGKRLGAGSVVGTAMVWDVESGRELATLTGHSDAIQDVAMSADGRYLATASADGTARVWDVDSVKEMKNLSGTQGALVDRARHTNSVLAVAFSADGKRLATGSLDRTARVWDIASGRELITLRGHTNGVSGVWFTADGSSLVTSSYDGTARVWDIGPLRELLTISGASARIVKAAFSADGKRIAAAGFDGARIFDAEFGRTLSAITGPGTPFAGVSLSPDGKLLATASLNGRADLWDAGSMRNLHPLVGHTKEVTDVTFSPDGKVVGTASWDGTVRLWDVSSGQMRSRIDADLAGVNALAFSPGGERLATAALDNEGAIWDTASGKRLARLKGHRDRLYAITFSPDGARVATGSEDQTAKVWDAATGKPLLTLTGALDWVQSVAFSRDGRRLATGDRHRMIKIWNLETGKQEVSFDPLGGIEYWVGFSPDGRKLASASEDGSLRLYAYPTADLLRLARSRVTRGLTPEECQKYWDSAKCP